MPRHARASSRNRRSQSRAVQVSQSSAPAASVEHQLKADNFLLSPPDFAKPKVKEIPELIALMLDEVWRHTTTQPKKVFVDRFHGYRLSTGRRIGKELAGYMATCCRAAIQMEGGNHWQG